MAAAASENDFRNRPGPPKWVEKTVIDFCETNGNGDTLRFRALIKIKPLPSEMVEMASRKSGGKKRANSKTVNKALWRHFYGG